MSPSPDYDLQGKVCSNAFRAPRLLIIIMGLMDWPSLQLVRKGTLQCFLGWGDFIWVKYSAVQIANLHVTEFRLQLPRKGTLQRFLGSSGPIWVYCGVVHSYKKKLTFKLAERWLVKPKWSPAAELHGAESRLYNLQGKLRSNACLAPRLLTIIIELMESNVRQFSWGPPILCVTILDQLNKFDSIWSRPFWLLIG